MSSLARSTVVACALLLSLPVRAGPVTIKLGTMAPEGSTWHLLLKQMGERWSEASGGQVKLRVYASGVAGNEEDMVRKMRIGQLQAAALTVVGLHNIETSPQVSATPGLIGSQAEWDYVFPKMVPVWEKRLEAKGFVTLAFGDTGTVHMFLKRPIRRPADMAGVKTYAWAGDPASVEAWRLAGFEPVVLSPTDITSSLATGMIDAFGATPILAFSARLFERAPFMPDAAWGHLAAATIVQKEAWERIPAEVRPKLLSIASEVGKQVDVEVLRMQVDAVEQMKKAGLKVLPLSEADRKEWEAIAEKSWPAVRGGVSTPEAFDEVKRLRDAFRLSLKE